MKPIHYTAGVLVSLFIFFHLFNHAVAWVGIEQHVALMRRLRTWYRHPLLETILLLAIAVLLVTGVIQIRKNWKLHPKGFEKLKLSTGAYLAFFFLIHLSAVFIGRIILKVDTDYFYGTAGLKSFPANLFFIPYYCLGIFSVFGHLAAVHRTKMKRNIAGLSPSKQAILIVALGVVISIVIVVGLIRGIDFLYSCRCPRASKRFYE